MSTTDPRHYDIIVSPVITEKATMASERNQVVFKVRDRCDQAADQGRNREAVRRQGEEASTRLSARARSKVFRGMIGMSSRTSSARS